MNVILSKRNDVEAPTEKRTFSLYELIEAVDASVEPGEEAMVPLIVSHILSSCNATIRPR